MSEEQATAFVELLSRLISEKISDARSDSDSSYAGMSEYRVRNEMVALLQGKSL